MTCDMCNRPGQLVCQSVHPGADGPWVFRYYLCRWHRAGWNRTRLENQRKIVVREYVDDATLLGGAQRTLDSDSRIDTIETGDRTAD